MYSDFAFGDSRRSLRLWMVSKERNQAAAVLAKQTISEYLPHEQSLLPMLEDAKQYASKLAVALLVGNGRLWCFFIPPGFYFYVVEGKNGKVREVESSRLLALRYNNADLMQNFHIVITAERLRGDSGFLSRAIHSNASEQNLANAIAEQYSVSGPIGILSKTAQVFGNSRTSPLTLAYVTSNRGQVRKTNEDCGSVVAISSANGQGSSRRTLEGVADGVGGLAAGEIASRIAISVGMGETIFRLLKDQRAEPASAFHSAFESANENILKVSSYTGKSIASTLSLGIVEAGKVWTANAGDTRIYLAKPGANRIAQLTVDHRLERDGPQSHVITRSLGSRDCVPDLSGSSDVENGDYLVSCSDGLHDLVEDNDILEQTRAGRTPKEICVELTAQANSRGGKDNITVATLLWKGYLAR